MALSRTNLLGEISAGFFGTGDYTSTAFTPVSNSLLVVGAAYVENNGATTDPTSSLTISGGSLTFTQRQTAVAAPTAFPSLVKIYTAPVSTGASMTLTIGTGGRPAGVYGVSVVCYTGYNTGTPIGGTATGSQNGGFTGPPDPASITLSAAPSSGDEVFGFIFADKATANISPGSTYTEIDDLNTSTWGSLESEIRTGSTSTTVDWVDLRPGGGSLFNWAAVGIIIQAAASASAVWLPTTPGRRRLQVPRRRPSDVTPVRAQVNPPFPINGTHQPRQPRGVPARRPHAVTPTPAQVIVTPPSLPPQSVRERVRGLRLFRPHTAAPPPDQALLPPAPARRELRGGLRPFRPRLSAPPVDQQAAGQPQRARLRAPRIFRGHAANPVPGQVIVQPPAYPPAPVRTRLRGLRLYRPRVGAPVPPQVTFAPVAYVMQSVRSKVRGLRVFRGRTAAPVPPQVVVTPPPWVPAAVRTRIKGLRPNRPHVAGPPVDQAAAPPAPHVRAHPVAPRRGHSAGPPVDQAVPPAAPRVRPRLAAPRRGHSAAPVPPQTVPAPPYPSRPAWGRPKALRAVRGRQAAGPVPAQVVVPPPLYPPSLTRARERLGKLFRGAARLAWPQAVSTYVAPRRPTVTVDVARATVISDQTRPTVTVDL